MISNFTWMLLAEMRKLIITGSKKFINRWKDGVKKLPQFSIFIH